MRLRVLLAGTALIAAACAMTQDIVAPQPAGQQTKIAPAERRALFGELRLHTVNSFDAWTFGTKLTPDEAYKFASGQTVMVPAYQLQREQGINGTADLPARRAWPLDFAAVTDHAEYLGAVAQIDIPGSDFSKSELGQELAAGGRPAFFKAAAAIVEGDGDPETTTDLKAAELKADAWEHAKQAANKHNKPGVFTTFIGYEWTATPGRGVHMHRNVLFNGDDAPKPFTAVDSDKPEDLWTYLTRIRMGGLDNLAIPHNSNFSDGKDFDWFMSDGKPMDAIYALQRSLNEPLVEIAQTKGTSETAPDLSASDEFANFEIMDHVYEGETKAVHTGGYVRQALGRGLVVQSKVGENPFKMGFVGASDIHNGLSASDENSFASGASGIDAATMLPVGAAAESALDMTGQSKIVRPNGSRENDPLQYGSAAITGVWAEENTRGSIFAALKRRETFATSGTRIRVRMFGGWDFASGMLAGNDWVDAAYRTGVPMGADMPIKPDAAKTPRFVVQAMMDASGARLDRIQIVKVRLDGDNYKEKVFDVALSGGRKVDPNTGKAPSVGNTVNLTDGSYANTIGASELSTVWTDPEFDPKTPAIYYARVLEIPTPRWSTLLAIKRKLPIPDRVAATIQERAWTSPIWYTPAG
ncbi:MAG: DUF3604 domain-containing protein [Hyphomonadaceae bacterium]